MNQETQQYINQNMPVVPCMYHFSNVEQMIACTRCEKGFGGFCPVHDMMPFNDGVMY